MPGGCFQDWLGQNLFIALTPTPWGDERVINSSTHPPRNPTVIKPLPAIKKLEICMFRLSTETYIGTISLKPCVQLHRKESLLLMEKSIKKYIH